MKWNNILPGLILLLWTLSCNQEPYDGPYNTPEGIYTCQESSAHSGVRKYFVEIDSVSEASSLYIISNFHNKGESDFLYARIHEGNLEISNQVIKDLTINGSGMVDEDFKTIQLIYTTDDGITQLDYTASYTR